VIVPELADIIDASEVAEILGVSGPNVVSVYRQRHVDFPEPVLVKSSGKCVLWLRQDVEAWAASHPRRRS
jgi:predicted DNA-binding transcriptional regulator AlpA